MDEHANKIYLDGAVNVKNPPEKDGFVDKYNNKAEDDDLS